MKISVIIPIFNVAPYLEAGLESALEACRHAERVGCDVELVCIDDGSTDGSGEILETWVENRRPTTDDRQLTARILRQENSGVSAARNAALEVATGDWVAFLDADDVLHPDAIVTWARLARESPEADIVSFGMVDFEDGQAVNWTVPPHPLPDDFCRPFFLSCYRRSLVSDVRFSPLKVGEDGVFWGRVLDRCVKLVKTEMPRYAYRRRTTSVSNSPLTVDKVRDDIAHRLMRAEIVWSSSRRYDLPVRRLLIRGLLHNSAQQVLRLDDIGRLACRPTYGQALARLAREKSVPLSCRLLAELARRTYSPLALWLFCVCPFRFRDALRGRGDA